MNDNRLRDLLMDCTTNSNMWKAWMKKGAPFYGTWMAISGTCLNAPGMKDPPPLNPSWDDYSPEWIILRSRIPNWSRCSRRC